MSTILSEQIEEGVTLVTLNRPESRNALAMSLVTDFIEEMKRLRHDRETRVVILNGAGRGFCAGVNLSDREARQGEDGEVDAGAGLEKWYNPFFIRLRDLCMPIVTAVNGPAAGVGMSLALMGDMTLAARSAFFLQAFRRIGLVPDGGATYILPRRIGFSRAMELSRLGERLPADKALEWGLINRVYDDEDLMPEAVKLSEKLANGPTETLRLIRSAFWQSGDNSYEEQLALEAGFQRKAGKTQDFKEGVLAFFEKRPARFQGK